MKAMIDRDGCIGCGLCADTCPEVFCMDDANIAEVCGDITDENQAGAQEAANDCPVSVIEIED